VSVKSESEGREEDLTGIDREHYLKEIFTPQKF
jgi:hypothetical protein